MTRSGILGTKARDDLRPGGPVEFRARFSKFYRRTTNAPEAFAVAN